MTTPGERDPDHDLELLEHMPRQVVAAVLRAAALRTDELLAGELPLRIGGVVRIVCVPEVEDWLRVLASRVEAGERLAPSPG